VTVTSDTISERDRHCRYIRHDPNQFRSDFTRFLESLGLELPRRLGLEEAVHLDWIRPRFRFRIPDFIFLEWKEYPLLSGAPPLPEEDEWVDSVLWGPGLYELDTALQKGEPLPDNWYLHPLDVNDDPDVAEILEHSVSPEDPLPTVELPNGVKIKPWVDFFSYWDAYRLIETLLAGDLLPTIFNTPSAEAEIRKILDEIDTHRRFSTTSIQRVQKRYDHAAETFEWISLYRTAVAMSMRDFGARELDTTDAVRALLDRIGRSPEELKLEIRDVLLVIWKSWIPSRGESMIPSPMRRHFQQDIARACHFLEDITKRRVDYRDPLWYHGGRLGQRWAQLKDALPNERWIALEDFPFFALLYLEEYGASNLTQLPRDKEELRKLAERWLDRSYPFARFTIVFKRLHDLVNRDRDEIIRFRARNVVDYLLLSCLIVEKLMLAEWIRLHPNQEDAPGFSKLLKYFADRICAWLEIESVSPLLWQREKETKLYNIKSLRTIPLMESAISPSDIVFETLRNFTILRNYTAHHDAFDRELELGPEGGVAARAVVMTLLLVMVSDEENSIPQLEV
jgi:hypothetical protein